MPEWIPKYLVYLLPSDEFWGLLREELKVWLMPGAVDIVLKNVEKKLFFHYVMLISVGADSAEEARRIHSKQKGLMQGWLPAFCELLEEPDEGDESE